MAGPTDTFVSDYWSLDGLGDFIMACIVKSSSVFYTVTFNGNGGSSSTSVKVMAGQSIGMLPSSSRTGYTFNGWFTEAGGGSR